MHVLDAGVSLGWRGEDRRCECLSGEGKEGRQKPCLGITQHQI